MKPDVCYRCPSTESLDGALRNELAKSTSSLIPTEIEAEFVFTPISTITVPVTYQPGLDALIEPADFPQSLAVEYALCRQLDGKPRLQIQRVVAKSIVDAIAEIDGFGYSERRVHHPKEGGYGARFLYVCNDSTKNHRRKANEKKGREDDHGSENSDDFRNKKQTLATYDCGGTIIISFSTKRDGVNVVYTHNPIHRDVRSRSANAPSEALAPAVDDIAASQPLAPKVKKRTRAPKPSDGVPRKRGRPRKIVDNDAAVDTSNGADTSMPTSSKNAPKKRIAKGISETSGTSKASTKKTKAPQVPVDSFQADEPPLPPRLTKGGACNRCREKKIKCDGVKPTCNQCKRGLWTCH